MSRQPPGQVGFCVSEGLTSRALAVWLAERGTEVTGFLADIGQRPGQDLGVLAGELTAAGVPTEVVDLTPVTAELYVDVVRYQAHYEGGYWNTTGASRAALVSQLAALMDARGIPVLGHGSVVGGNDERRFSRYVTALRPRMLAHSPWSDPACGAAFSGRAELSAFARERGLSLPSDEVERSVDGNLGGFSHEGPVLERLGPVDDGLSRVMSVSPQDAPDLPETFTLNVEEGVPVGVDGRPLDALRLIELANAVGGRNGLGFADVLENRLNGTKCRGVYEAPGLELLSRCLTRLYRATQTVKDVDEMRRLSTMLGERLYSGQWFSTAADAARDGIDAITARATGSVSVSLYRGHVFYDALRDVPPHSAVPRQARFGGGGHRWQVLRDDEREETASA
jgi:argininosuccinate synthase